MKKISKGVASLLIFTLLFGLYYISYGALSDPEGYNIIVNENESNMASGLNNLTIVQGVNETLTGVYTLSNPTASTFDILGALASSGIGIIKGVGGLLIFPFQIGAIIQNNYDIPAIFINSILIILTIIVAFLIISAFVGRET